MHLLLGAILMLGGCGLFYLLSRQRFDRSNGRAAETYQSFHHKIVSNAISRVLSFAAWVLVLVGIVLLR